jgi:hypothetical protein
MFPPSYQKAEENDFANIVEDGAILQALCEGCGYGEFDHTGKRIPDGFSFDEPNMNWREAL